MNNNEGTSPTAKTVLAVGFGKKPAVKETSGTSEGFLNGINSSIPDSLRGTADERDIFDLDTRESLERFNGMCLNPYIFACMQVGNRNATMEEFKAHYDEQYKFYINRYSSYIEDMFNHYNKCRNWAEKFNILPEQVNVVSENMAFEKCMTAVSYSGDTGIEGLTLQRFYNPYFVIGITDLYGVESATITDEFTAIGETEEIKRVKKRLEESRHNSNISVKAEIFKNVKLYLSSTGQAEYILNREKATGGDIDSVRFYYAGAYIRIIGDRNKRVNLDDIGRVLIPMNSLVEVGVSASLQRDTKLPTYKLMDFYCLEFALERPISEISYGDIRNMFEKAYEEQI